MGFPCGYLCYDLVSLCVQMRVSSFLHGKHISNCVSQPLNGEFRGSVCDVTSCHLRYLDPNQVGAGVRGGPGGH